MDEPVPEPAAVVEVQEAPPVEPPPEPPPIAVTSPPPAPPPPPPPVVEPDPGRVVVLLPRQLNGFEPVLPYLDVQLTSRKFETVSIETSDPVRLAEVTDGARHEPTYVIAVGSEAARIAVQDLRLPTVFCQIPDQEFGSAEGLYGVATMPPLALQLQAWKQLDPSLGTIGLILGRDEYLLAAQARNAAEALGLSLELQLASSDQEAVYLFKRMAPRLDGLWLLPDNAVLSPRALREMLGHANSRHIQSLAFTPALLEWGALLSVTGTPANIAWTIADVMERMADDRRSAVQAITALSELEAKVNRHVADQLGLEPPADAWIVRSGDW